jgi:hypothetical protein
MKECSCIIDFKTKQQGTHKDCVLLLSHAFVLNEMALWFSSAENSEVMFTNGKISQKEFEEGFHRTTTLKLHPQGSPMKMVDMSIKPLPNLVSKGDYYLPQNYGHSSTMESTGGKSKKEVTLSNGTIRTIRLYYIGEVGT